MLLIPPPIKRYIGMNCSKYMTHGSSVFYLQNTKKETPHDLRDPITPPREKNLSNAHMWIFESPCVFHFLLICLKRAAVNAVL